MAKRGQARPWRMIYRWEHGLTGTQAFPTRERAEDAARAQRARRGPAGERCQAWVQHRDAGSNPAPAAALSHTGTPFAEQDPRVGPRRACLDCPKRAQPGSPWCAEHD